MTTGDKEIICPFCEQGVLKKRNCGKCGKTYLLCDECESIYKNDENLDEEVSFMCPYCGKDIIG